MNNTPLPQELGLILHHKIINEKAGLISSFFWLLAVYFVSFI